MTHNQHHTIHHSLVNLRNTFFIVLLLLVSCTNAQEEIKVGAARMTTYLPLLKNKRIALVVNQTSVVNKTHLVDTLLSHNVNVKRIFAPEHGFRGTADAGEQVADRKDVKTGLPIISLYGKNKKPTAEQLHGIDCVIFDIQDVGVRFYTYISTMHYVMEACAESNIPLLILDRPNPNGSYIDGPVLEKAYSSFVGMDPIPVVHGLTIGELARMINGEGWLKNNIKCQLTVIPVAGWTHQTPYSLPIKPSPNLPNDKAINLYPSLCFFEPTAISIGRGTLWPFQIFGSPEGHEAFSFTPISREGMSKYPKHENKTCYGKDLRQSINKTQLDLSYLIETYQNYPDKSQFFTNPSFFNLLAGNKTLQDQIKSGLTETEIRASWQKGLFQYKKTRTKYLIYD